MNFQPELQVKQCAGEAGDWGKKSEWQVAYTDEEILDLRPIVGVHEDSVHGVNSSVEKGDCILLRQSTLERLQLWGIFWMVELGKTWQ